MVEWSKRKRKKKEKKEIEKVLEEDSDVAKLENFKQSVIDF